MKKALVGLLLSNALIASPAGAALLVDTGPSTSPLGGYYLNSHQSMAAEFTLGAATSITGILGWIGQGNGTATAVVYTDAGEVPGTELFSAAFYANEPHDWYGPTALNWSLVAGTYWVAFEVRSGQTFNGFMRYPSVSPLGNEATNLGGTSAYVEDDLNDIGVRIYGEQSVVPEPATVSLLALGLVGLAASRHRGSHR